MSLRHNITRVGAAMFAVGFASPGLADDAVPLATVARELGFTYAYLPYENAVSLARPGATVIVRPGDAFFSVNERREPVYGIVPVYRNNDVYVSRAFVDEIRGAGSRATSATTGNGNFTLPTRPLAPSEPPGRVATAIATYDERDDRALVSGMATPGSIVGVALRAELAAGIPVVVLDRTYVVASDDGTFAAHLSFGFDHFAPSRYVVEAYGEQNEHPILAPLGSRTSKVRTSADDGK